MPIAPHVLELYKNEDYILMNDQKPPIGEVVDGVRVFINRGFGAVILSTKRLIVQVKRTGEYEYEDILNEDRIASSEVEAWKHRPQPAEASAA